MKLVIEVRLDRTGETLARDKVEISTNPEHIRAAKLEAAVLIEDAVNILLERALGVGTA